MAQLVANSDVWTEILQYFKISLDEDTKDGIDQKRRTILSVALTCSQLADAGLNELWRSMTTLEPIARVFHGVSGFEILDKYWDMDASPSNINAGVTRSQSYLQRVRYLRFKSFPDYREQALWRALLVLAPVAFICPNLKGLNLNLENSHQDSMHNFSPLISPSIVEVSLTTGYNSDLTVPILLLSMLKRHNVQLLRMTYIGYDNAHPHLFQHITQFPTLSSLIIGFIAMGTRASLEPSHIASFQNLSRLTRLEMDMRAVRKESETVFGHWLASLDTLSSLSLCGYWDQIHHSVLTKSFKSLSSLSLTFLPSDAGANTTRINLFHYISLMFPKLGSVNISSDAIKGPMITLEDILMLKGRPMERIHLHARYIALTSVEVISLLTAWPTLQELHLDPVGNNSPIFEAESILTHASAHGTRLRSLSLPLDFSSLTTELSPMMVSTPNCPLRKLGPLRTSDGIPNSLEKKHTLVRNLITLFPRLDTLEGFYGSSMGELQQILDAFQKILLFPPRKSDHLFYYD